MRPAALATWRKASGGNDGPIFCPVVRQSTIQPDRLEADAVSIIPRDHLIGAGISLEGYSDIFLWVDLATSTIGAKVPTYKILAQTGHASDLVLARSVHDGGCFTESPSGDVVAFARPCLPNARKTGQIAHLAL